MIIFDQVTKQFSDESYALKEVSFDITPGEFILLTGPSGSGKTTIMRVLTGEYIPTAGDVTFGDTLLSDISRSKIHLHRRQIGVVFQDYKLLTELNVWENIALALNIIGKDEAEIETRVTDLLRLVNLTEKAFLFPSQLSGGEAQRVSIARALATGPSVIFADEPTGNLDPETSLSIARLLKKINELGTTILFATHDISVLQALPNERNLHLNQGQLVKDTNQKSKTKLTKDNDLASEPETEAAKTSAKAKSSKTTEHHDKDLAEKETPTTDQADTDATEPVEVKIENIDQKPTKIFGLSLSWPFGKKKRKDELLGGSDKNEDLNHLHTRHELDPEVSVESLSGKATKSKK